LVSLSDAGVAFSNACISLGYLLVSLGDAGVVFSNIGIAFANSIFPLP